MLTLEENQIKILLFVAYFIKSLSARELPYWMQSVRGGHFAWPSRKSIPQQKWVHLIVMLGAKLRSTCLKEKHRGDFFYRKSTIGTTKAPTEANNGIYCLRKRIEKFPLVTKIFFGSSTGVQLHILPCYMRHFLTHAKVTCDTNRRLKKKKKVNRKTEMTI